MLPEWTLPMVEKEGKNRKERNNEIIAISLWVKYGPADAQVTRRDSWPKRIARSPKTLKGRSTSQKSALPAACVLKQLP
jgi:hypothetical protein